MAALGRWVGAKIATLEQVMAHMPTCNIFVEPMCGMATVGLAMAARGRCRRLWLSDINARLINMLIQVRDRSNFLVEIVQRRAQQYNESLDQEALYGQWVAEMNAGATGVTGAVLFLIINRICFNGLYRENSKGEFNVGFGKRKSVAASVICTGITEANSAMRSVQTDIAVADYREVCYVPGDVSYVDSPYAGVFGAYHAVNWKDTHQVELAKRLKEAKGAGVHVFTSNSDTPLVRGLYAGSTIHEIAGRSSVSCQGGSRGARRELLIEVQA